MKGLAVAAVSAGLFVLLVPIMMVTALLGGVPAPSPPPGPSIPATMLARYLGAAATCPGLPWTVLAAIGTVESDNGLSSAAGVWSGHNGAGAEGPMQFEPATFARYARPVPIGGADPPTPYDPTDAVYAAARLLCAGGAGTPTRLRAAIFAYNHSTAYVDQVLGLAGRLARSEGAATGVAASEAVAWAVAQLGTPYRWGGETPGVGFDCSGLVQAAWRAAGVQLPRVAAAQFAVGPALPPTAPLQPGDLVFFGPAGGSISHVGMVVGPAVMIDAPHSGASVRVEAFPMTVGAAWGDEILVGATRPGGY